MTAITYLGEMPTPGADEDTWGTELVTIGTKIGNDLSMLNTTPTSTILGRVTASTGEVERLTGAQAATVIPAVIGASQSVAGTKGAVPAPAAAEQNKVLAGDGTWRSGLGRAFGCIIASADANGTQPTLSSTLNVASISTLTVSGSDAIATLTFTNALPSADYAVHITGSKQATSSFTTRTTTTVVVQWGIGGGGSNTIAVSGFA